MAASLSSWARRVKLRTAVLDSVILAAAWAGLRLSGPRAEDSR
ncbi:MAG: hypothetical protein ACRDOB_17630 [Streptosporangiaceae bacterium]